MLNSRNKCNTLVKDLFRAFAVYYLERSVSLVDEDMLAIFRAVIIGVGTDLVIFNFF